MIRLPKYVFREGDRYVLRHPSGAIVNLGNSLKDAKALHKEIVPKLKITKEVTAAAYQRQHGSLWGMVDIKGRSQCWMWTGPVNKDGYGYFKGQWAHRLAWMEHNQMPIAEGGVIRHSCDNPGCCNPWHLEIGTPQDNVRDRDTRGRTAKGQQNGRARLVEEDVLQIFLDPSPYSDIARRFSVTTSTVCDIKTGRNWGWLTGAGNSHGVP